MAPAETLIKTAKAYLNGISSVDADVFPKVTTESCSVTIAPASSGFGDSASRDALIQRFTGLKNVVSALGINIKQIWPNEAANQVTIWTDGTATFSPAVMADDSPDEWIFKSENVFIFTMDESGEKVQHLFEFSDSKGTDQMGKLFGKAFGRLGVTLP